MPVYEIEAPDGRIIEMEGNSPPSEKDIQDAFAMIKPAEPSETAVRDVQVMESMEMNPQKTPKKAIQDWKDFIKDEKVKALKGDNPILSKIYPRITEMKAGGDESGDGGLIASSMDVLSLPGRVMAAVQDFSGDSWDEKFENYFDSIAKTEGDNIATSVLRHPATAAALVLAPTLAPIHAMSPMSAGIAEGAGTGLISQLERMSQGQDVNPLEATADVGISMLFPGLSAGLKGSKAGATASAEKIMESVIKPKKKLTQSIGSKFDTKNIFKYGIDSPQGIKAMQRNVSREMSSINKQYSNALETLPKGTKVDLRKALNEAKIELADEVRKGKYSDEIGGLTKGLKHWDVYLEKMGKNQTGVKEALAIRKGVGKMASYDKMDVNALKGVDVASKKFYEKLNGHLDIFPQIRKLDKQLSEVRPIQEALDDAAPRIKKNFIQSLNDNPALLTMMAGGGVGATYGGASGAMMGSAPGLALLGASKAQKSPGFASMLHSGGKGLGVAGDVMNNPYLQRTVPGLARVPLKNAIGEER